MSSLISSEDTLFVWAAVIIIVACAIVMEQKWKWAAKVNSCTLCIIGGILFANLRVIPMSSPVYGSIGGFILPLAIPLLLFKSDMRKIYRESGKCFVLFNICAVGAVIGALIGFVIFRNTEGIEAFSAVYCASAVGGSVNLVAVASVFNMDNEMMTGMNIVANFTAVVMLIVFSQLARTKFFLGKFKHAYVDEYNAQIMSGEFDANMSQAAQFWKRKDIALKDIAKAIATTFAIVSLAQLICNIVNVSSAPNIIKQLFGSLYLVMTLITVLGATFLPNYFTSIHGADELGNLMMLIWFVTIGTSCNIEQIIRYGLITMAFFVVTFAIMCAVSFTLGRVFKMNMEEMMACVIANIGGPPTAAALAISNGWSRLVAPGMLIGVYGYVVGNYFGVFLGNLIGA